MPGEQEVYEKYAAEYEQLVESEDYQGNLLRALEQIRAPQGLDVVDLGAGTGRLARRLAGAAHSVRAFDASGHMLARAGKALRGMGLTNWQLAVADHRALPAISSSADLVVSGWSFCYLAVWGGATWRAELEAGLREVRRVLRPGGSFVLFETLGTGQEAPLPPAHLHGYYDWLREVGFQSTWIRTDYRFASLDQAAELSSFFFGDEMAQKVRSHGWVTLPECTGMWWLQLHPKNN